MTDKINEEFVDNSMDIVTLVDDDGSEIECELVDILSLDGEETEYAILAELVDGVASYDDPFVARIEDVGEDSYLYVIDDEDIINKVYDRYNELCDECDCDCDDECDCENCKK